MVYHNMKNWMCLCLQWDTRSCLSSDCVGLQTLSSKFDSRYISVNSNWTDGQSAGFKMRHFLSLRLSEFKYA